MFSQLAKIIQLQTTQIKEVPTRLEKDKMKDFAQLLHRFYCILNWFFYSRSYHRQCSVSWLRSYSYRQHKSGFTVFLIVSFILDYTTDNVQSAGKDHTVTDNTNQVLLYS